MPTRCSFMRIADGQEPSLRRHPQRGCRQSRRAHIVLRTNGIQSHIATVEADEAMAVLPRILGDRRTTLRRLIPPLAEPSQPVKLGVHAEMRNSPRIRAL